MPLNLVLAEFQAVHLQLMDYLHTIPEEEYKSGTRFMRRLGWDTFKHYPEHAQIIRELLRNQENQVDI